MGENDSPRGGPRKFTKSNAAFYGSRGGVKSGETRRRKKSIRELATAMLSSSMSNADAEKLAAMFDGIGPDDASIACAIISKQIQAALRGDIRAAQFVVDIAGDVAPSHEEQADGLSAALERLADEMGKERGSAER